MGVAQLAPGVVVDPGLWQSPENILNNNNARASISIVSTAQNQDHPIVVGGFTGDIPAEANLASAMLSVQAYGTNPSGLTLLATVRASGVNIMNRVVVPLTNVEATRTFTIEGITLEQLRDPSLEVVLIARKSGSNSRVHMVDYVNFTVNYYVEQLTWFDGTTEVPVTLEGVWDGSSVVAATYDGNSS